MINKEAELLISANAELEKLYFKKSDPCLALLVSRNYRLLLDCNVTSDRKLAWVQKAKYWWQLYLKACTGKFRYSELLLQHEQVLFRPINTEF